MKAAGSQQPGMDRGPCQNPKHCISAEFPKGDSHTEELPEDAADPSRLTLTCFGVKADNVCNLFSNSFV